MKRIGKNLLFAIAMIFTLSMVAPEVVPITTATTVEAASVKLNYSKLTLYKGQKKQLKLKGTKKKAKWSSNRKTVVSVDKKGKIIAKKQGTAVITAKVGKKNYKCKVTVKVKAAVKKIIEVRSIDLNKKDITLTVGQTQKLTAKFTPANATNKSVRWSSDNPKVATVDSNGNIKAVSEGETTIWCRKNDNYGFGVDYCLVTVKPEEKFYASETKVNLKVDESKIIKIYSSTGRAMRFDTEKYSPYYAEVRFMDNWKKEGNLWYYEVQFKGAGVGESKVTFTENGTSKKIVVDVNVYSEKEKFDTPKFSVYMSDKTSNSTKFISLIITNNSDKPIKILGGYPHSIVNDKLTYFDLIELTSDGDIKYLWNKEIAPGKMTTVTFCTLDQSFFRYDRDTFMWYSLEYDGKVYTSYSNSILGTMFY